MALGFSGLLSYPFVNSHTNIMGKERNYVCMSKLATQYLFFSFIERTLECFQDLNFRFEIQTEGLKPNYFKKQCSLLSFLLTYGNNTGPKCQWSTQQASSMS